MSSNATTAKPLNVLRKAFSKLKKSFEKRRKDLHHLLDRLARRAKLTDDDENWLDNDGNLVTEERVIDTLDAASDFERGVERLSDDEKAAFQRLRQAAGLQPSRKRKFMFHHSCSS
jgi:predicted  nucleic acid-binding Zn-ribbon protein